MTFLDEKRRGNVPSYRLYMAMLRSCVKYGDVECAQETLQDMERNNLVCISL